jgi:beta-glucosidase/6-phospho-beta-glucosidase/beta-galactosidase
VYDWDRFAPMLEHAADLGLTIVVDLVHYGVPAWLSGGLVDPDYPAAVAEYAAAFAVRFGHLVDHWTPLNEPGVTAAFCGESGGWPPYLSGPEGWTAVTLAVADGIQRTVRAIRAVQPEAVIVHVEASKLVRANGAPGTEEAVALSVARAWLPTDLLLGRVDRAHPLRSWLADHGAGEATLDRLASEPVDIDVMGVNFYPQYSVREVVEVGGEVLEIAGGGTGADLVTVMRAFAGRYGRPVAVTETSYDGDDDARRRWLMDSTGAVQRAASSGLDVWGYTWWPLFDFVDWGIAAGGYPFEDFRVRVQHDDGRVTIEPLPSPGAGADPDGGVGPWLRRMGLWRLEPGATGLARVETPVAQEYRAIVAGQVP